MRLRISAFDTAATGVVGHIPETLVPSLHWLGRFTTPPLWMAVITGFQAIIATPGAMPPLALTVVLLIPLATVLKLFFRRARPATVFVDRMRIKSYSFPSSHAYSAALGAGYFAWLSLSVYPVLAIVCIFTAFLIGISRVRVGAHYPTDVAAGWLLGILVLSVVITISKG